MSEPADKSVISDHGPSDLSAFAPPFMRAPEGARTVYIVTLAAACAPLLAGVVLFGWRAAMVAVLSIFGCVLTERAYYRVTRTPALLGRSHAYLTGVLLALTLPAWSPWYVPLVAAAFAVIVGKAIFGGVGHFLWQPALVGRLAVAVMFPMLLNNPFPKYSNTQPILAQPKLLIGDICNARRPDEYRQWRGTPAPDEADALLVSPPEHILAGLTREGETPYAALINSPEDMPQARLPVLLRLPPMQDMFYGTRPGGLGETCAIVILFAGMYLIYRNYVKWQLPAMFVLTACVVAALAPIRLAGPGDTVIFGWVQADGWRQPPLLMEGLDTGIVYVCYQLLSGEVLLAAFFLATEMTSRPVTAGGQALFGIGCGAGAMLLKLYTSVPIPAYLAVLGMNTLTPLIDAIWRPRVLGQKRLIWRLLGRK